jgi:hypothetical protein
MGVSMPVLNDCLVTPPETPLSQGTWQNRLGATSAN